MKKRTREDDRSAGYARDRIQRLLLSERVGCSPQTINMLRNDLIHTVKKYIRIREDGVRLKISQDSCVLRVSFPIRGEEEPKKK